ncbi:Alpha/Beta hydrolase protein [Xylariomycetidae sp. FL2044]|nr:Alpha/Beta hydrolase protein [Xylariomycetidae sp. FL2044]
MATTLWSTQPLKTVYTIGYWTINIPHLLFLSLLYTVPPFRAVRQWGYQMSMATAFMRALFRYMAMIRHQRPPQLTAGKSKDRFVLIEPPDEHLFRGVFSPPLAATRPAPVGAVWHPAPITPASKDSSSPRRVVVFAPGGGFVLGLDPEEKAADVSLVAATRHFGATHVLYMQYRLASTENPFPAAAQDLFTTYQHVLGLGVAPEDIVLMGDSAGANLVLAVLRYLVEHKLPQPGGAVLFSPWVEVTMDAVQRYSRSAACRIDILDVPLLTWAVDMYRPKGKALTPEQEAYISPLNHPFQVDTPIYIDAGSLEGPYESTSIFSKQMMGVEGNRVKFHTSANLPHDYFLAYPVLGVKKEACAALEEAKSFLGR